MLLSANVPVAVKGCVSPLGIDAELGLTATETRGAGKTVKVVDPWKGPVKALMVVVPAAFAVASPVTESIVATAGFDEDQTEGVMLEKLPSDDSCARKNFRLALNCSGGSPTAMMACAGKG